MDIFNNDQGLYDLPDSWEIVNLGIFFDKLQYGYTASASKKIDKVKLLRITDIQNRLVNWETVPGCEISDDNFKKYQLENGDFVFARTGSIEKAWVVKDVPEAVFASYLIRGTPVLKNVSPWLQKFIETLDYVVQIRDLSAGIGRSNVNAQNLSKVKIPLPPLNEQKRIVEKIEELFTKLDAGIELLKKLQVKLKRYRQSVLKSAFEGKLTEKWRQANQANLEPAEILLKRILQERREKWEAEQVGKKTAKYQEPIQPNISDLPDLPEGWCWVTLISLCSAIGDVDHKMPKAQDNGIPYISTKDFIQNGDINFEDAKKISQEDYEKLCRKIYPEENDILLSRYGTVGEVRIIKNSKKFQASYSIAILKPVLKKMNKFIAICLTSEILQAQIKKYVRGVAQPDLGLVHIRELMIPFPCLVEQEEIVSKIDDYTSLIDQLEKIIERNIKRAEKLRQSILKQAFTGKLVPQDINDEPAAKLLEKIKQEKAKLEPKKKTTKRSKGNS